MAREAGHRLLERLGKTKLRPGGVDGTNWLLNHVDFDKKPVLLEVACNKGFNLINFAQQYDGEFYGIDKDEESVKVANEKLVELNLNNKMNIRYGDATNLPFEDNTFDVVLNEAMLTMLNHENKEKAIKEYYRVLKPGGILLTHDVLLTKDDKEIIRGLQKVINIAATPLVAEKWTGLFKDCGFKDVDYHSGEMTLMSEVGMLKDEGEEGMQKILENAMKDENKEQFYEMMNFFNDYSEFVHYIVVKSVK